MLRVMGGLSGNLTGGLPGCGIANDWRTMRLGRAQSGPHTDSQAYRPCVLHPHFELSISPYLPDSFKIG